MCYPDKFFSPQVTVLVTIFLSEQGKILEYMKFKIIKLIKAESEIMIIEAREV